MSRRAVRHLVLVVTIAALVAAGVIQAIGGIDINLGPIHLTANRVSRLLWLGAIGLAAFFALGGRIRLDVIGRHLGRVMQPGRLAVALSLAVFAIGIAFGTRTAGGSDSYGYMSQAYGWLSLRLSTPQPWAAVVPWPNSGSTFVPLGHHLGADGASIVSMYSPGLPMLLAVAIAFGGACAAFVVVPVTGAIAVFGTYALGRHLHSAWVGLAAAWLLASSPVFIDMLLQTMSDVPSTAAWVMAFACAIAGGSRGALGSGLATAVAILIRVSHAPMALPLIGWWLVDAYRSRSRRELLLFAAGLLPGVVGVAAINWWLYGSPISTGYGDFSYWFRAEHVRPNLRRYTTWLGTVQTPVVWFGVAALLLPTRYLWADTRARQLMAAAAAFVALLVLEYLFYAVFEDAQYLRFLLAGAPFVFLAGSAAAAGLLRGVPVAARVALVLAAVVLLAAPAIHAWRDSRYPWLVREAQQYYVTAADAVAGLTNRSSVVLSMQHSGSVRYYGRRTTLRYDNIDPVWLDRTVAWLAEHGAHPYALLEPWEVEMWRGYFKTDTALARLDLRPVFVVWPENVAFYDLLSPGPPEATVVRRRPDDLRCRPISGPIDPRFTP